MTLYIKGNMLWMLFVQKKKLENNFIVGVEPCLNGHSEHYVGFTKSVQLKSNYSGINSIKLFTRNQYRVSNPILVSIYIVEIWYRTGTRLMHGTYETFIFYYSIDKLIMLF